MKDYFMNIAENVKEKVLVEKSISPKIKNIWINNRVVPTVRTKPDMLAEIDKCKKDVLYFVFTYAYIQHAGRGRIKLDEYPFLADILKSFQDNQFNIINKSRQLGISTIVACFIAWFIIFHSDKEVLVIATKASVAKNIIKKIRFAVKQLPRWMYPTLTEDNKHSLGFNNGSNVKAIALTEDAGRSEALSLLVIDEAAHIKKIDPEEVWSAAAPTLSTSNGKAIILSTPNGLNNWFANTYQDAEEDLNDFHAIRLHWSVHPLRDEAWRAAQNKVGLRKASQEYDCLSGNEIITLREKNTGKIFDITLKELYETFESSLE
jgi:phage terminase large subunit GpA-like protein